MLNYKLIARTAISTERRASVMETYPSNTVCPRILYSSILRINPVHVKYCAPVGADDDGLGIMHTAA